MSDNPIEQIQEEVDITTATAETTTESDTNAPIETETKIPKIQFKCANCPLNEACDYKGCKPPFAKKIEFREECYVMQDPFSPPPGKLSDKANSEYFMVLGADCSVCQRMVCAAGTCSIFYAKTYCLHCANGIVKESPLEIQSKIRKLVATANAS